MDLKIYNTENASRTRSSKPIIAFSAKGGVMRLNKTAAEHLGIKEGEKWAVAQDKKNVLDWYLFKDKEAGFKIRVSERGEATFNSSQICEDIRACVKNIEEGKSCKMFIAAPTVEDKTTYYPILTSSAH